VVESGRGAHCQHPGGTQRGRPDRHAARGGALAGEWYSWFVTHVATNKWSKHAWRAYRDSMWEGLCSTADGFGDPFDHGDMDHMRPIIADEAKTAQFFAAKRVQLDPASRNLSLDYLASDFFAALDLLTRRAEGDFGDDKYSERFPKQGGGVADSDLTPWVLFERWIAAADAVFTDGAVQWQDREIRCTRSKSALPLKADIHRSGQHFHLGPRGDIFHRSNQSGPHRREALAPRRVW
jgi:hypothetical protein